MTVKSVTPMIAAAAISRKIARDSKRIIFIVAQQSASRRVSLISWRLSAYSCYLQH